MQLLKEEYARKRINNGRLMQIENSVTLDNCSASLVMPNSYPYDGIFNPHITTIKDSYILAYQKSVILIWDRDSYLTHVILPWHSTDKIHVRNWSVPGDAKVSASCCIHKNLSVSVLMK